MKNVFTYSWVAVLALLAAGCSSSSENTGTTTNGVNDLNKACAIRTAWTNALSPTCNECIAFAKVPRCECQDEEYAGRCSAQQSAKNREPTCDGVDGCVNQCKNGDCACVDTCYAGKDACRPLGAATDGCLAEICDTYCR
ncbi:hypothetical protein [Pendulispora albinea]|uniref:Uncharacterized protein n=1 Tax=Pendulispora albinea TaxID=2741071 RepID=A0ABZ2LTV4_9BACT